MKVIATLTRWILLGSALAACAPVARASEVGRFAAVQNRVTSLKPGAAAPVETVPGAVIVLDEEEATGPASAAKMTFAEWGVISIGQETRFKVTRQAVAEATGVSTSGIYLLVGRVRVFVSRFWSGRPEVRVSTPTAVVGIKGSEVVVKVAEDGTTVVTIITGSASVKSKDVPGSQWELGPSEQITVPAGRRPVEKATKVAAEVLAGLRDETDPHPAPPRGPLGRPPTPLAARPAGGAGGKFAANTTALSSSGTLMASPTSSVFPGIIGGQFQLPPLSR